MLEVSSSYTNKFVISAIGHMQEAIDEINTICDQLNPRIVEELGFKEALTTLSIQAKGMVMFHLNLPENDSLNLDSEVQLGVFRIVQNYLTLVKGQYPIFEATVTVSQSPKKVFITFKRWNSAMLKSVSATYEWTGVINRVSYLGGMISFRQKEIKIAIPRKASN